MRSLIGWMLILFILFLSPLAFAVRVQSIYQAEIPVPSEDVAEKDQAFEEALGIVLVKLSGNSHILENNPNLRSNLKNAGNLVDEYTYSQPDESLEEAPLLLSIRFNADGVNKLLRESGSLMWGEERPLILAWLSLETPPHSPEIVDSTISDIPHILKKTAKERGLPVIFPILDVTDLSQVNVKDLDEKSLTRLKDISKRYTCNALLVGKLTQTLDEVMSHWELTLGDDRWSWDVTGKSISDVMTGIVDNVADTLAGRYGVIVEKSTQSEFPLILVGITQRADLMRVIKYLQTSSPGTEIQLQNISDKEITLNLTVQTSKDIFLNMLAHGKILEPVPTIPLLKGPLKYKLKQ